MSDRKKTRPLNTRIMKKIYLGVIFAMLIPGVYFFGKRSTDSDKIALAAAIVTAIGLILLLALGALLAKKDKQRPYIKILLVVMAVGLIGANVPALISSYFIPNRTTTIHNRYYPVSLEHGFELEYYTMDKTVWIDPSNDFFERAETEYSAIDHINIVSIMSSLKALKVLDEPFGRVTPEQAAYLTDEAQEYRVSMNVYNREENMYFYTGMDTADYDEVVFLLDADDNKYFMPYAFFLKLKEIG